MLTRSRALAALILTALLVAVSACGSSGDAGSAGDSGQASGASPVTIKSAVGTTTVKERPRRVVTLGWGSQDAALALGVKPVGMQDMTGNSGDDTGILPWDADKLGGTKPTLLKYTTNDVPYEDIVKLRPDVILAVNSGLTKGEFAKLNKIAPTVGYPGKAWLTTWQDQVRMVGKALGLDEKAAALEKSTEELISTSRKAHPEFAGKTIAFGSGTTTDAFNVYLASDSRVELLKELGFSVAPSVPTSGSSFAVPFSLEKLGSIDSDVLVSWYLSKDVQDALQSSPTFERIPAVQRKGYVPLTDPALVYATSAVTVLSLPWVLDRYLPMLSDAANGKAS